MAINAVLFDFSGTLFRLEHDLTGGLDLVDDSGAELDVDGREELMRRMTTAAGRLGGLRDEYLHAWENRDLDPELHRKAYLEVLRLSGVTDAHTANALYERTIDPLSWVPYPDTEAALKGLASAGVTTGVLSNIAFDFRPAFTSRGLDGYVEEFVLSYEVGAMKPDPAIFNLALQRLGLPAEQTLMVGDSVDADGAARDLGCAFALVDPTTPDQRPDGLLNALREHGLL